MQSFTETASASGDRLAGILRLREAMLYRLMIAIDEDEQLEKFLNSINYDDSGFTKSDFIKWWRDQESAAAKRRAREKIAVKRR